MIKIIQDHALKLKFKIGQSWSNLFDLCKSLAYEKENHTCVPNQLISLLNWN